MSIGDRIKEARKKAGLTQTELAEKIGVSKGAIGNYETGLKSPKDTNLFEIMKVLNVDANYLFQDSVRLENILRNAIPVTHLARIPIIGTVRAGYNGIAYEDLDGYDLADVSNPDEYFFLRVEGDSMEPEIREGELALVHKQDTVDSGDIAVVIINGDEGTIKKVKLLHDRIILVPFNPNCEPRVFIKEETNEVRFAGKVVETKRKW